MLPLIPILITTLATVPPLLPDTHIEQAAKLLTTRKAPEAPQLQPQERRLQTLTGEQTLLRQRIGEVRSRIEALNGQIDDLKHHMHDRAHSFLTKKLSIMSQQHAILIEWEETLQKSVRGIEAILALLHEQESPREARAPHIPPLAVTGATPSTEAPRHALLNGLTNVKAVFSFDDIMAAEQRINELQDQVAEMESSYTLLTDDSAQRKKAVTMATEEYQQKLNAQQQFTTSGIRNINLEGLSQSQQGEIIDLEERLAWYKQEFAQARVQEVEITLEHTETLKAQLKAQLGELKKDFNLIKKRAHISAEYVEQVMNDLNHKRQAAIALHENINENIRVFTEQENIAQQKIKEAQQKFGISAADLLAIRNLTREPRTSADWKVYARILDLLIEESLQRIGHEFHATTLEVNKAQIKRDELRALIVTSWHRMTNPDSQFTADEDIEQEIKAYCANKAELEHQLAALIRAREGAIKRYHESNVSFDKLRVVTEELARSQHTAFKEHPHDYYTVTHTMDAIRDKIGIRFDWMSKLIETYSTTIAQTQDNIKKIDSIIRELTSKSFWRRSELSISWIDLVTFLPELRQFFLDLGTEIAQLFTFDTLSTIGETALKILTEPLRITLLLVNSIIIITCYFVLKLYLPDLIIIIAHIGQGYWMVHGLCVVSAAFLSFLLKHLQTVYLWILCLILIQIKLLSSIVLAQLFYLLSIPYALWLAWEMVNHWRSVNREKRFMFISEKFERRFFIIVSFMLSVLIVVTGIREAFILGPYTHSHVPIILLALLFILGQVSLICLLRRSQILGMLQADTPLLQWVYEHVSRYYYILWLATIGIIVMSNPYVGYGRQVFYIITRTILTAALIPFFSWIHGTTKNISLGLFFYYADRETLKERFITGRFWYIVTLISSLLLFLLATIYFGAKLWGFPITGRDIIALLRYPMYTQFDDAGHVVQVTFLSFLHIIPYVIAGFVIAYCVNTFVLCRILDPLIVESGVQNTILTLVRYAIITITLFVGLTNAGLGGLTTKLAILFAGISFAVQDVVKDFLSYFVLLVQRPIKVGDFIRILDPLSTDENVSLMGFVRSITPRSIVVRKRNSTTVIIPNSRIVTNPIMNWSYTRGFFAFDDIRLSVTFTADPSFVRQLMLEVLDKNPHVLKNPAPIVRLDDFTEGGYSFLLRGFLSSNKIGDQWDIASDLRIQVVKILRDNQIEIASPRRFIRILPSPTAPAPATLAEAGSSEDHL